MLLEFSCRNFRSFREEATLSLLPINAYKERPENLFRTDVPGANSDGVLTAAVIYGGNASGKTNLLKAVAYAQDLVLERMHPGHLPRRESFVGDGSPTEFRFSFVDDGERYEYGFSLDDDGVADEELRVRSKAERLVFRRTRSEQGTYAIKQGSRYSGIESKVRDYSDNGLVLGMLSKFGIEPCVSAVRWFASGLSVVSREAPSGYPDIIRKLAELGQESFSKVIGAVSSADLGITGAQLDVDDMTEDERRDAERTADRLGDIFEAITGKRPDGVSLPDKKARMQFRHVIGGQGVGLGFDDESLGTVTMLDLAADLVGALDEGVTLFVDEIERSLHPVLLRSLVALFSDGELNRKGAQLVFTTHDMSFLSEGDMRRDQVWFVEKDAGAGESELYPLSSFSPRKDESLANRYLHGAYGAVPYIDGGVL